MSKTIKPTDATNSVSVAEATARGKEVMAANIGNSEGVKKGWLIRARAAEKQHASVLKHGQGWDAARGHAETAGSEAHAATEFAKKTGTVEAHTEARDTHLLAAKLYQTTKGTPEHSFVGDLHEKIAAAHNSEAARLTNK